MTKEIIDEGVLPFWFMPLIQYLESRSPGDALKWAIDLVFSYETLAPAVSFAVRREWLVWLKTTNLAAVPASELFDRSRTIWYWGGINDRHQTAIARLYEAAGCNAENNETCYRQAVHAAIYNLSVSESGQDSDAELPNIFTSFLVWSKDRMVENDTQH